MEVGKVKRLLEVYNSIDMLAIIEPYIIWYWQGI